MKFAEQLLMGDKCAYKCILSNNPKFPNPSFSCFWVEGAQRGKLLVIPADRGELGFLDRAGIGDKKYPSSPPPHLVFRSHPPENSRKTVFFHYVGKCKDTVSILSKVSVYQVMLVMLVVLK